MRIWIYGILTLLSVSSHVIAQGNDYLLQTYRDDVQKLFALTPDCRIFIQKAGTNDFITNYDTATSAGMTDSDCANAEMLHFLEGSDSSNLMIFLPTPINATETLYKGMKVYGTKIVAPEDEMKEISFKQEFEIIDYTYVLPPKCGFDPMNFKVGIDINVIYMLVTCENHIAFLRAQINFEESIVFTPKSWLVHFDQAPAKKFNETTSPCAANKLAFVPSAGDYTIVADSYVLRYCDKITQGKVFYSFATELHHLHAVDEVAQVALLNGQIPDSANITNLFFLTSQVYVMKFDDKTFYMGTVDDRNIENPTKFMGKQMFDEYNRKFFTFTSPVVMIGREYTRVGGDSVDSVEGNWIFRSKQDPELQQGMDASLTCDYVHENQVLADCESQKASIKTVNIILYCLLAFEFIMILATIAIFAFCIFTQRKRRRLHREKKAMRRGKHHGKHGKHGKKKNKKEKDEVESESEKEGGKSTEKSTPKKDKESKKDTTDNNNETDKKSTDFYSVPSKFGDKSKDKSKDKE